MGYFKTLTENAAQEKTMSIKKNSNSTKVINLKCFSVQSEIGKRA